MPSRTVIRVDRTPPQTEITGDPPTLTNEAAPTFTFRSDEDGAMFECRVGEDPWEVCASPYTTAALEDGEHVFEVRAADPAGNLDPTAAGHRFTVDTVAPQTTITTGPAGPIDSRTATFEFTSNEAGATFECSLDDGELTSCTSPYTTGTLTDGHEGDHRFVVRATDRAGNTDPEPAAREFSVRAPTNLRATPASVRIGTGVLNLSVRVSPAATITNARAGAPVPGRLVRFTAGAGTPICSAVTATRRGALHRADACPSGDPRPGLRGDLRWRRALSAKPRPWCADHPGVDRGRKGRQGVLDPPVVAYRHQGPGHAAGNRGDAVHRRMLSAQASRS